VASSSTALQYCQQGEVHDLVRLSGVLVRPLAPATTATALINLALMLGLAEAYCGLQEGEGFALFVFNWLRNCHPGWPRAGAPRIGHAGQGVIGLMTRGRSG
jgi:hypothetical protein